MSSEDELSTPPPEQHSNTASDSISDDDPSDVPAWLLTALKKPLPPPPPRIISHPDGNSTADRVVVVSNNYSRSIPTEWFAQRLEVEELFCEAFEEVEAEEEEARFEMWREKRAARVVSWVEGTHDAAAAAAGSDEQSPSLSARHSISGSSADASPEMLQDRQLLAEIGALPPPTEEYQRITASGGNSLRDWTREAVEKFQRERDTASLRAGRGGELSREQIAALEKKVLHDLEMMQREQQEQESVQRRLREGNPQAVHPSPVPRHPQGGVASASASPSSLSVRRAEFDAVMAPSQRRAIEARRHQQQSSSASGGVAAIREGSEPLLIKAAPSVEAGEDEKQEQEQAPTTTTKKSEAFRAALPPGFLFRDKILAKRNHVSPSILTKWVSTAADNDDSTSNSGMQREVVSQDTSEIFYEARRASEVATFKKEMETAHVMAGETQRRRVIDERRDAFERMLEAGRNDPSYQKTAAKKSAAAGGWSDDVAVVPPDVTAKTMTVRPSSSIRTSALAAAAMERVPRVRSPSPERLAGGGRGEAVARRDSKPPVLQLPSELRRQK